MAKTFPKHNQRANYVKYQYHEKRDLCEERIIIIKLTEGDRCRKLIVDNGIFIKDTTDGNALEIVFHTHDENSSILLTSDIFEFLIAIVILGGISTNVIDD